MKIKLLENVRIPPIHVNTPRRTAYAHQKAAEAELDRLVRLGVLEKVEGGSKWISPMSFVAKQDGSMRLVADLVHLNKYVKRPVHPFTEVLNENGPFAHLWSKMLIFKRAFHNLRLQPNFCPTQTF